MAGPTWETKLQNGEKKGQHESLILGSCAQIIVPVDFDIRKTGITFETIKCRRQF